MNYGVRCPVEMGCLACESDPRNPDPHGKVKDGCDFLPKGGTLLEQVTKHVISRVILNQNTVVFELGPETWQALIEETATSQRDLVRANYSSADSPHGEPHNDVAIYIAIAGRSREFRCSSEVLKGKVRAL